MNLTAVKQGITRNIGRKILVTKKNSPHIFFVGGVAGVVTSAVLACRATLRLEENLDQIKSDLDILKRHDFENDLGDANHTGFIVVKSVTVLGKLYGPSIAVGVVSVAALTGSHIQLTRRNAALTATLALVTKAYDEYRLRVQEEIGVDRELDIYRSVKDHEVTEGGKKKLVKVHDPNGRSPYSRIFDETSQRYEKDAELNRLFLTCQQEYANHRLRARGHIFLNEVYDDLGFERTAAGSVVGWIINGDGDGFVDFGMFDAYNSEFINGRERACILDFNVDGVIYDKI